MDERRIPRTAGPLVEARSTGIKVLVESHVWRKINGWCNAAKTEVSGMFMVKQHPEGFYAYDVFLPEQMGSAGYTVFDPESYGRLKFYVFEKYGADGIVDLCRGWWHTHYNFSPFWSGTDDGTAQQHMYASDTGWAVSIVVNQKGAPQGEGRFSPESGAHYKCRVDILNPAKVTVDDLPVVVVPNSVKRRRKTNFKWDIERWVKPFRRVNVPRYVLVPKQKGIVLDLNCPCQDFTCPKCEEALKYV